MNKLEQDQVMFGDAAVAGLIADQILTAEDDEENGEGEEEEEEEGDGA